MRLIWKARFYRLTLSRQLRQLLIYKLVMLACIGLSCHRIVSGLMRGPHHHRAQDDSVCHICLFVADVAESMPETAGSIEGELVAKELSQDRVAYRVQHPDGLSRSLSEPGKLTKPSTSPLPPVEDDRYKKSLCL